MAPELINIEQREPWSFGLGLLLPSLGLGTGRERERERERDGVADRDGLGDRWSRLGRPPGRVAECVFKRGGDRQASVGGPLYCVLHVVCVRGW